MELASQLEKTNQKLTILVETNDTNVKKLQMADQELANGKRGYAGLLNDKKVLETKLNEYSIKITEITNINNSLSALEVKLADDRANKAAHDAQHFEGLLREETAKIA